MKRLVANEAVMHEKIQQLEASGEIVGRQLLGIQSQFQFKRSPDIHDLSSLKERNGMLFYTLYSVLSAFIEIKPTHSIKLLKSQIITFVNKC